MPAPASLPVLLEHAARGRRLDDADLRAIAGVDSVAVLAAAARRRREQHFGERVTWSPKVFIALTRLCRDVCHYCTFAKTPRNVDELFLSLDQVRAIAKAGQAAGCTEALFTLGDKPERRYREAAVWLEEHGYASTIDYVRAAAQVVLDETGLLPHLNPGVMDAADYEVLRPVSASMGLMLESTADRLCRRGGVHFGSPDKEPAVRLESIRAAGVARIPFTSGILIGIGETRAERVDALLALRELHEEHGHLQEIIVQNFRAKSDTKLADAPEPDQSEHLWSIALARLIMPCDVSVQAPPNLADDDNDALVAMLNAGINDFGGVSPVTPDHVNPEKPWPDVARLEDASDRAGMTLAPRLAVYPEFLDGVVNPAQRLGRRDLPELWVDAGVHSAIRRAADVNGYARGDLWSPGSTQSPPASVVNAITASSHGTVPVAIEHAIADALDGQVLDEDAVVRLLDARGAGFSAVCAAADHLRREIHGDRVSFVVNRNINYTNICVYKCRFCAFSKGSTNENLRGKPYDLDIDAIGERVSEAWARGATEVCLQGGIHPRYTGTHYLDVVKAVKEAAPEIHLHAFTPLEISQGASTLGIEVPEFLAQLVAAGLDTLPGTSAEILDDSVRKLICPDKLSTAQWLDVMRSAHELGLKSTATIMFGHLEQSVHQARHLLRVRALGDETGGFTEFVPLPFVHMEAPMFRRGESRRGPTFREAIALHAVARLVLQRTVPNIQGSWVKLGAQGLAAVLRAGVNDAGGTLMNESITRAAGAVHGQEFTPAEMRTLISGAGFEPWQRTTLYTAADETRIEVARNAAPELPVVNGAMSVETPAP